MLKPDFLFETSWEICNKVGGIYTVLSTKACVFCEKYGNNYVLIGPDVWRDGEKNPDFIEDAMLLKSWRVKALSEGLKIRIGRWNIVGKPAVVLVDFTQYFEKKDDILKDFWIDFKLDSISGQWDYIEPALFGYAAGKVIESFYNYHNSSTDRIIAHFHEWMTGTGGLYLKKKCPQIGTVFTTHATALGRCIAGNLIPLYRNMSQFNAPALAEQFNIKAKYSLEKLSAEHADAFTTVSDITNEECKHFLDKPVDVVTINGFETGFVPEKQNFEQKRREAKASLLSVARGVLQREISKDAFLIINSGRYEFSNKGIDVFIEALAKMNVNPDLNREVIAFIAVPAHQVGARADLPELMTRKTFDKPATEDYLTHHLYDYHNDAVIQALKRNRLFNNDGDRVKVIFVPSYLNGNDGIFNKPYYDLLIGFDLSVFPSYYEPWGYTPLESVAFGIPTITTTLAGFGIWAKQRFGQQHAAYVVERNDDNAETVSEQIAQAAVYVAQANPQEIQTLSQKSFEIADAALWKHLADNYETAYDLALTKTKDRHALYKNKLSEAFKNMTFATNEKPTWYKIMAKIEFPESLKKLELLSQNLWWCWNYEARDLFIEAVGEDLWEAVEQNPVFALQKLDYQRLSVLENTPEFMNRLNTVYQKFENYMSVSVPKEKNAIAYLSMEFGLTDEIKIFSGGLGMLAGDYLKEASDCNVNMIGVGLLYRHGYFTQQITSSGEQINNYPPQSYSKLPLQPLRDEEGNWQKISFGFPGRTLWVKLWRLDVGRIPLYLLDTDLEENSQEDRAITHSLYGGDWENRLKQEIVLGCGAIRMFNKLGLKPQIFHCNEGHAALVGIERLRNLVQNEQISFIQAIEMVKASSLFTTHTPVPAGHDAFSEDLFRRYLSHYPALLNIDWKTFMGLGRINSNNDTEKFSMSNLACRLSQEVNGVSRIHGRVSREMFAGLYDGYLPEESHISYVTNGVHYPTWTHKEWQKIHSELFGKDFLSRQSNPKTWENIHTCPDETIWNLRNQLRCELLDYIKIRLQKDMKRRFEKPHLILETLEAINPKALTVGFARRFATYKRAHLLFSNRERLKKLLNDADKPMIFLFAGKAHPHDKAGQDLIKIIIEHSKHPDFIGKIIFIENYDMALAKKLVSGCDIWLNNPTRPLEASGTSGEKAIMNGVLNFSVLDGWWAEGYVPDAGWALPEEITYENTAYQDELDATQMYEIFEEEIAPLYYQRNEKGIPEEWVGYIKNCFSKISPLFTMKRQLDDYYAKFYNRLYEFSNAYHDNHGVLAAEVARWKEKVKINWNEIHLIDLKTPESELNTLKIGDVFHAEVKVFLGNLKPEEVSLEVLFTRLKQHSEIETFFKCDLKCIDFKDGTALYTVDLPITTPGVWDYAFRLAPNHPKLAYKTLFPLLKWL